MEIKVKVGELARCIKTRIGPKTGTIYNKAGMDYKVQGLLHNQWGFISTILIANELGKTSDISRLEFIEFFANEEIVMKKAKCDCGFVIGWSARHYRWCSLEQLESA